MSKKFFKIPKERNIYAKINNIQEAILNKIPSIITCLEPKETAKIRA